MKFQVQQGTEEQSAREIHFDWIWIVGKVLLVLLFISICMGVFMIGDRIQTGTYGKTLVDEVIFILLFFTVCFIGGRLDAINNLAKARRALKRFTILRRENQMKDTKIFLTDGNGNQIEYDYMDIVPVDGAEYLVLLDLQNDYASILRLGNNRKLASDHPIDEDTEDKILDAFWERNREYLESNELI